MSPWLLRHRPLMLGAAALALLAALAVAGGSDVAQAQQANPFGGVRPPAGAPPEAETGLVAWIAVKQAEFYRALSAGIRAAKADGSAVWGLLGLSFAYGVFHAAGPGHGKAVISSYLIANGETWRRGVVLSFASSLLQALVAVLIVGIAAGLIGVTARTMTVAVNWIEMGAYGLIVLIGLRLVWVKGRGLLATWRRLRAAPAGAAHHLHQHHDHAAHDHVHGPGCAHPAHDHGQDHTHDHATAHPQHDPSKDHSHDHFHGHHASVCGHAHGPEPGELAGPGGWRRGLSAIVAVGLRPCSGAIIVLVFAMAQGLFWAGIAATFVMGLGTALTVTAIATFAVGAKAFAGHLARRRGGYGTLAMHGIEVAAALLVLLFGLALLAGFMTTERMVGI